MKKNYAINIVKVLILIICIFPTVVNAAIKEKGSTYGDYETTIDIVQEVMKAYYFKGPKIQYNFSKTEYGVNSPEEATKQDIKYLVCAGYTYSTLAEAFGMYYSEKSTTPRYNSEIISEAAKYYKNNKENLDNLNGSYLIYYENTSKNSKAKYIYKNPSTYEEFVDLIQPGDLFVFSGHALMAYDVVEKSDGTKDVLILHSIMTQHIPSAINPSSTTRISFNILNHNRSKTNGLLNIANEGTITWTWLSDIKQMVNEKKLTCSETECAVIRTFYKGEDGKTVFNYEYDTTQYNNSLLRTQFPGLQIEKTSNVGDNNSVHVGDKITYTIKITNKSNATTTSKGISLSQDYVPFYIEETLDENVQFVSSAHKEFIDESNNNQIKWKIKDLGAGESIELKYTVEVKNNLKSINNKIISRGKFFVDTKSNEPAFLTTGVVENKIVPKVTTKPETYKGCYKSITSTDTASGLELIDKIYKCVYGDYNSFTLSDSSKFAFTEFSFEEIFGTKIGKNKGSSDLIYVKDNLTGLPSDFYNMILNNYWNGLTILNNTSSKKMETLLPRWAGNSAPLRARTIVSEHFKDGDVLIYKTSNYITDDGSEYKNYTNENGLYAYIYIDGKFVGINKPCGTSECERNEFTYEYYTGGKTPQEVGYKENDTLVQTLQTNFYTRIRIINYDYLKNHQTEQLKEIYEFINYQTLFGKEYYVIFRPELLFKEIVETIINNSNEYNYIKDAESLDLKELPFIIKYNDGTILTYGTNTKKDNIKNLVILFSVVVSILAILFTIRSITKRNKSSKK